MKRSILYITMLVLALSGCTSKSPDFIVACGWDEVFIADISEEVPRKVWSWSGDGSEGLPSFMRNKFLTTDECKPVDKGEKILITSSGGGVALVDRESSNTLFYASIPNAHSAEYLPGGIIAVAASFSQVGNRVNLYQSDRPDDVISSDSLYGAHGLYWDRRSDLLWALGTNELKSYSINEIDGLATLKEVRVIELPEPDGHDLSPSDTEGILFVTTANSVWLYNPDLDDFVKHHEIGDQKKVKSVSYSSISGETIYVKATEDTWWAYYIRFAGSDRVIHFPGEKIYKARWLHK